MLSRNGCEWLYIFHIALTTCRYFQDVLNSTILSSDTNEIQLNKDGSWSTHVLSNDTQSLDTPCKRFSNVEIISDDLGKNNTYSDIQHGFIIISVTFHRGNFGASSSDFHPTLRGADVEFRQHRNIGTTSNEIEEVVCFHYIYQISVCTLRLI